MSEELKTLLESLKAITLENDGEIPYWGEKIHLKAPAVGSLGFPIPNSVEGLGNPKDPTADTSSIGKSRFGKEVGAVPVCSRNPSTELGRRGQTGTAPHPSNSEIQDKTSALEILRKNEIGDCLRCALGQTRKKLVFGVGNPAARVMFVGEGPGFEEDRQGEPFVGKAGQLLDKILAAIQLDRQKVYIANIVKCHPMVDPKKPEMRGNDRPPTPEEMAPCLSFLKKQIDIINPVIIVTLGATAAKALLNTFEGITRIRGKLRDVNIVDGKPPYKVLPTYHPAALLRNPDLKKDVWEDMKLLRQILSQ